jgi:hypothetical protein
MEAEVRKNKRRNNVWHLMEIKMFSVAEVRTGGVTLTNGFLPTTSPDHAPVFSESDAAQFRQGNFYNDGFFNMGKDVVYDYSKGPRNPEQWTEWGPNSADLAKTSLVSGYNSWELMRESLRPYKNQMFPNRIFDQDNGSSIDALPGKVSVVR